MPDDFQPDNEGTIDISSAVGYWERRWRAQVSEMDKVLHCLGWDHFTGVVTNISPCPPPTIFQPASKWRSAIQRKRQEVQDCRTRHMPTDSQQSRGVGHRKAHISDDVKLIDKSYLEKKCKSPDWESTITEIASEFSLNREQDHAFRIVANHACNPGSDQLKMHVGGMGGTGKSQVLKALIKFFEA